MKSFHNLTTNMQKKIHTRKQVIHEIYWVSFFPGVTSIYSVSPVSLFTIPVICLSFSASQFPFYVSYSLLALACHCQHSQLLPHPSLPSISSDRQHLLNPLTTTSGEICCHGLGPQAQWFYMGPLYCHHGVRIWFPAMSQSEYNCFECWLKCI
jgi:hypothetical protein